ncbi:MAG: tetratricopeptide repeat-containing protein kinase family protein, partial [Planctomycetota bacterium]
IGADIDLVRRRVELLGAHVARRADHLTDDRRVSLVAARDGPRDAEVDQVIGTPCYMSPEQLDPTSDEIDVRADVYSLGIVLYELLCCRLPYDFSDTSITTVRRCLEQDRPTRPSLVASTLRGDLEVLVLTAISKDREQRYQSAADLADDIQRYLAGELIEARSATLPERAWHWVRHHVAIASLIALTALSLTTTAVAATLAYWNEQRAFEDAERGRLAAERARAEAEKQRERARESEADALRSRDLARLQTERAEELLALHESWLMAPDLYVDGPATKMVDVLGRAAESLDETPLDPLIEIELREILGGTMQRLGRFEVAAHQYERAWELERAALGTDEVRPRATRALLARMLQQAGDLERAHALARESLESLHEDDPAWLRQLVHGGLGAVLYELADYAAAEPHLERALELSSSDDSDGRVRHAAFVRVLGTLRRDQGRFAESRRLLEESIEIFESVYGPEHALTNTARLDLAQLFLDTGETVRAEALSQRALEALEAIDPDMTHSHIARTVLARVLAKRGEVPRAEAILRESVPRLRELGGVTPLFLRAQTDLGQLLAQKNEYEEAIELLSDSFDAFLAREGQKGSRTLITANELIRLLNATGRFERAAEVGLPLLAEGPPPPGTADTWTSMRLQLGNALQKLERHEEALEQYELGRQEVVDTEGEGSPRLRTFDMTMMFLRRKGK